MMGLKFMGAMVDVAFHFSELCDLKMYWSVLGCLGTATVPAHRLSGYK